MQDSYVSPVALRWPMAAYKRLLECIMYSEVPTSMYGDLGSSEGFTASDLKLTTC